MSLYSFEEICEGCRFAVFHKCEKCIQQKTFCHCSEGNHESVDHCEGTCKVYSSCKRREKK